MEKYIGKSVYKGTAIGPVSVLKKKDSLVKRIHIDNTAEELKRLDAAKERTMTQLGQLYEKALQEVGEVNAAIFEVHQMMLEDDDYQDAIHNMIQNEEVNAEYAVAVTGDNFAEMFANMDDEYMQARSADVRDISNRLVRNLSGEEQIDWSTMEPSIIVADDLTPSETVQMDKSKILAFVTVHGSTNSHTAILARMMNIPALIGVPLELEKIHNGTRAIVDGREAVFYLDPEEEQLRQAEAAQQTEQRQRSLLADYKGRESVTKSGRKVMLVVVPEHGAAEKGDKVQVAHLRDIPSPAITHVPALVKFIGVTPADSPVTVDTKTSYLAVSSLIGRVLETNYFGKPEGEVPLKDLVKDLPQTHSVSENANAKVVNYKGKDYVKMDNKDWREYAK